MTDKLLLHMLQRAAGPALERATEEAKARGWKNLPPNPWRAKTSK